MAIEGPLRELGIHDVFQLLDLSRKTGTLRVTSELRDDEGTVHFDNGRVVQASVRSKPSSLDRLLTKGGRVSEAVLATARARCGPGATDVQVTDALIEARIIAQREVERLLREQLEAAVFELMSWREGFFSFEERPASELPRDPRVAVSTESLLMESARRIDEWSRIADKVPNLQVIPVLAAVSDDHGPQLDLLPHEWEMLTMIDGVLDLHGIASAMGRSDFEIAKVAYGLVTTGVIELQVPRRRSSVAMTVPDPSEDTALADARAALGTGDVVKALGLARAAVGASGTPARLLTARILGQLERHDEAVEELRHAVRDDPLTPRVHLDLGFAAVRIGDFAGARASWEHFLRLAPTGAEAARARAAIDTVARLVTLMEAHADG